MEAWQEERACLAVAEEATAEAESPLAKVVMVVTVMVVAVGAAVVMAGGRWAIVRMAGMARVSRAVGFWVAAVEEEKALGRAAAPTGAVMVALAMGRAMELRGRGTAMMGRAVAARERGKGTASKAGATGGAWAERAAWGLVTEKVGILVQAALAAMQAAVAIVALPMDGDAPALGQETVPPPVALVTVDLEAAGWAACCCRTHRWQRRERRSCMRDHRAMAAAGLGSSLDSLVAERVEAREEPPEVLAGWAAVAAAAAATAGNAPPADSRTCRPSGRWPSARCAIHTSAAHPERPP